MIYSPECQKAAKKWADYIKKAEKYRTLFFIRKKEKWRAEALRLARRDWDNYAKAKLEKQREDANFSAVF